MSSILLPDEKPFGRRLIFFLAMEEYVAAHLDELLPAEEDAAFFLWQSRPTVIIGKNQDLAAEVNLPWCREHGVEVYRRKSGGGCVYSDEGNLMVSCVMRETHAQRAFSAYLARLVDCLHALGLPAVSSSHNDVLVGERKVSGNACQALHDATIVHGTLLWNSNMDHLTAAITPSEQKLAKHAVQSVRQRVTNLSELGITDLQRLCSHLTSYFSDGAAPVLLSPADIMRIEQIEQTYLTE